MCTHAHIQSRDNSKSVVRFLKWTETCWAQGTERRPATLEQAEQSPLVRMKNDTKSTVKQYRAEGLSKVALKPLVGSGCHSAFV